MSAGLRLLGAAFGYGERPVVAELDLEVRAGEVVGVLGRNGSGKTTLLRGATGLLRAFAGRVELLGDPIERLPRREIARRVAVVPQEGIPPFPFTALDVVLMGRAPRLRPFEFEGEEDLDAARRALREVGAAQFADREISALSGGERQRVVVARALAQEAPLLLADEPTAHLDLHHAVEVFALLGRLARERGLGVLVVTHDLNLAARHCDRLALLAEGRLIACGPPESVLDPPLLERAFGCAVQVFADAAGRPVVVAEGRDERRASGGTAD